MNTLQETRSIHHSMNSRMLSLEWPASTSHTEYKNIALVLFSKQQEKISITADLSLVGQIIYNIYKVLLN